MIEINKPKYCRWKLVSNYGKNVYRVSCEDYVTIDTKTTRCPLCGLIIIRDLTDIKDENMQLKLDFKT